MYEQDKLAKLESVQDIYKSKKNNQLSRSGSSYTKFHNKNCCSCGIFAMIVFCVLEKYTTMTHV